MLITSLSSGIGQTALLPALRPWRRWCCGRKDRSLSSAVCIASRYSRYVTVLFGVKPMRSGVLRMYSTTSANNPKHEKFKHSVWNWKIPAIPAAVGIGLLGLLQYRKLRDREREKIQWEREQSRPAHGSEGIVMEGPWQLQFLLTLPLRSISRLWGTVHNDFVIPAALRPAVYKIYAYLFKCNLDEVREKDLKMYKNLGEFFYREIELERVRQVDNEADLVSPSDGTLIHYGIITPCRHISHIKNHKYSVDVLLGNHSPTSTCPFPSSSSSSSTLPSPPPQTSQQNSTYLDESQLQSFASKSHSPEVLTDPSKFTKINTISYGVTDLIGGSVCEKDVLESSSPDKYSTALFYAVIYLAPGDYHRFHSPTEWVVSERRHIHGELLSVSPKLLSIVPSLFTLNERVVLLGKWKHGFFSMVPVGATNVGSVVLDFDKHLTTNLSFSPPPSHTPLISRQCYSSALHDGFSLSRGNHMGGFKLGSTVVLVFEAPCDDWEWCVDEEMFLEAKKKGSGLKVKVGEKLGRMRKDYQPISCLG